MRMVWRDQFKIDGGQIDRDHMMLIQIINNFAETDEHIFVIQGIKETLAALKKYTIEHFEREEVIQKEISYPQIETHQKQHASMISSLDVIIHDFREKVEHREFNYADIRQRTFKLLQIWLVNHILTADASLKPYLEKKSR